MLGDRQLQEQTNRKKNKEKRNGLQLIFGVLFMLAAMVLGAYAYGQGVFSMAMGPEAFAGLTALFIGSFIAVALGLEKPERIGYTTLTAVIGLVLALMVAPDIVASLDSAMAFAGLMLFTITSVSLAAHAMYRINNPAEQTVATGSGAAKPAASMAAKPGAATAARASFDSAQFIEELCTAAEGAEDDISSKQAVYQSFLNPIEHLLGNAKITRWERGYLLGLIKSQLLGCGAAHDKKTVEDAGKLIMAAHRCSGRGMDLYPKTEDINAFLDEKYPAPTDSPSMF